MTWGMLEHDDPELAAFGAMRFAASEVAYLATVRRDGGPRVHPVTPIVGEGRLFLFMEPTSPKGHDLRRDPRYALHCSVDDPSGSGGEFFIRGNARPVDDAATRELAERLASYSPHARYVLFELSVAFALGTVYEGGEPVRHRWSAS